MRTCKECKVRKPDYEFPRKTRGKLGIQTVCKECKEKRNQKKRHPKLKATIEYVTRGVCGKSKYVRAIDRQYVVGGFVFSVCKTCIRNRHETEPQKTKFKVKKIPFSFTINGYLFNDVKEHVRIYGYQSLASFYRTAIKRQLDNEKHFSIDVKHPRNFPICVFLEPKTIKEMKQSSATTRYASLSEFVRVALRNQLDRDFKKWQ